MPNQWQLSEIQVALTEAQAQDYATDQDMSDLALKWQAGAHEGEVAQLAWQPGLGRTGRVLGTREPVVLKTRYLVP